MAGPQASETMALYPQVRRGDVLLGAWRAIESNALTSQRAKTKDDARKFGADLPRNLRRLQTRLRNGYKFSPAYGATPPKGIGKRGKRPITVATLEDRVVQRAILDVLQNAPDLPRIKEILATATSVGGIPGRGVDNALELFEGCVARGYQYVAGSDIADFFNQIPKPAVVDFISNEVPDPDFIELFRSALQVELSNAAVMPPEDYKLFPTGDDGVAQGCPLSALAGNIVLHDFDTEMNDPARGLVCIRYIDDFIVVGRERRNVDRGMDAARGILRSLGMDAYDPAVDKKKAFIGRIGEPLMFLGHELSPGRYPPSPDAQRKFKASIDDLIRQGQKALHKAVLGRSIKPWEKPFAATIVAIQNASKGWRGTYRSSTCPEVFADLDRWVLRRVTDFERYLDTTAPRSAPDRRLAALGIQPMAGAVR